MRVGMRVLVAAGVIVFTGLVGPSGGVPEAVALDREAADLLAIATNGGRLRRLDAIERLRRLDSADARTALATLADSKDEQLAAFALSALGRFGDSAAEEKLEAVFEDTKRTSSARSFALSAWCARRARDGDDWEDVRGYVESHLGSDGKLEDAAASAAATSFGEAR